LLVVCRPFGLPSVDSGQLFAEKGETPFDARSLFGRGRIRQLTFAGIDQFFDGLVGGTDVVQIGRGHRILGFLPSVYRGPLQGRDLHVLRAHVRRSQRAGSA